MRSSDLGADDGGEGVAALPKLIAANMLRGLSKRRQALRPRDSVAEGGRVP